jgi:hypothetical protein
MNKIERDDDSKKSHPALSLGAIYSTPPLNRIAPPGDQDRSGRERAHQEGVMMEIRDIFANELPTAIYFCTTAVMLAVYALFALSLNRPARSAAFATRQGFRTR